MEAQGCIVIGLVGHNCWCPKCKDNHKQSPMPLNQKYLKNILNPDVAPHDLRSVPELRGTGHIVMLLVTAHSDNPGPPSRTSA